MNVQLEVLSKFKSLYGDPTYKQISTLSGIQMTRVFRISNGYEMKLSEYLKLKSLIDEKIEKSFKLDEVVERCKMELSEYSLKEVEIFCQRKLNTLELFTNKNNEDVA